MGEKSLFKYVLSHLRYKAFKVDTNLEICAQCFVNIAPTEEAVLMVGIHSSLCFLGSEKSTFLEGQK